jgi:hypothetical protein
MPKRSSAGFLPGLIVEGAVIGLVVTLLPKIQLGPPPQAADQRPSLAPPWRTAVNRPPAQPSDDPAYVERRLDQAGQDLLNGMADYLKGQADEIRHPPPAQQPPSRGFNY